MSGCTRECDFCCYSLTSNLNCECRETGGGATHIERAVGGLFRACRMSAAARKRSASDASGEVPVDKMNRFHPRSKISDLLRDDYSDRLALLERLLIEVVRKLESGGGRRE